MRLILWDPFSALNGLKLILNLIYLGGVSFESIICIDLKVKIFLLKSLLDRIKCL